MIRYIIGMLGLLLLANAALSDCPVFDKDKAIKLVIGLKTGEKIGGRIRFQFDERNWYIEPEYRDDLSPPQSHAKPKDIERIILDEDKTEAGKMGAKMEGKLRCFYKAEFSPILGEKQEPVEFRISRNLDNT